MYRWRRLTPKERQEVLEERQREGMPWHRPPHYEAGESSNYLVTAACYEHRAHIALTNERMHSFQEDLLETLEANSEEIHAWCILPNHYHALVCCKQIKPLLSSLGLMHGRLSFQCNGEESTRGRTVWHGVVERFMRSERHYFATLNYLHHNPVKHGYVERWEDWEFTSAHEYLQTVGREEAKRVWLAYPVLDYGDKWDRD